MTARRAPGGPAATRVAVRPIDAADRAWLGDQLDARWGGPRQAYGGELVDAAGAAGLIAIDGRGERVGFLVHRPLDRAWEIVVVEALALGAGIGTALVEACAAAARAGGATRILVVTTNDNLRALRFYQRRGFRLVALRPGAVDEARTRLKPGIPVVGDHGIGIRDELVLARAL